MNDYEGKASIVTSAGDTLATGDLVAVEDEGSWTGTVSDLLWGSHMVPQPFNPTERLRLDDHPDRPIVEVIVENLDKAAKVTWTENVLG